MAIHRFLQLLALITLMLSLMVYGYYSLEQRTRLASLILQSLQADVSELSYVLSRNLTADQPAFSQRPFLDRAASGNQFVAGVALYEDSNLLIATDPLLALRPVNISHLSSDIEQNIRVLDEQQHVVSSVRLYEGANLKVLDLVFFLDHEQIDRYLNDSLTNAIQIFSAVSLCLLVLLTLLLRKLLVEPLRKLRRFAYYHDRVPEPFYIRELESVRYTLRDTFSRLQSEQNALYEQARQDTLSGLANRQCLQEFVTHLIAESARSGAEFAFLFLDFDNFKTVNDSAGHEHGDKVIKEAAERLRRTVREYDLVARVGGDEFVIVLKAFGSKEELSLTVDRIQRALSGEAMACDPILTLNSSVGVAIFPADGQDYASLMKNSDIAMFAAKQHQKGGFRFFSEELNASTQQAIAMDKAMRAALRNNEYQLYFQPKINLLNGSVEGAEALIRWIRPDGTITPASEFIPMAEDNGFIVELGEWVLNTAARQLQQWREKNIILKMSVNIAVRQFMQDKFEQQLMTIVSAHGLSPEMFVLEITEYVFLAQTSQNRNTLARLHDAGFTLALDDFGKGYSSLSYLQQFAIDQIKIDKSFISDLHSTSGGVFIESIIKLGHALGKRIVAEGVETEAQLQFIKALNCNVAQGYYFSPALPASEFEQYLKNYYS